MEIDQMDSIWIEEEDSHHDSKLFMNGPSVQVINSKTPILMGRNTIQLPPLPPTSFFQNTLDELQESKKKSNNNKLKGMFKRLSLTVQPSNDTKKTQTKQRRQIKRKISTPFGFNHISHVNHETPITNKTFEMPFPSNSPHRNDLNEVNEFRTVSDNLQDHEDELTSISDTHTTNGGISFNRTSPNYDLKTRVNQNNNNNNGNSRIPRSSSNSTSLSSNLFTRSASISTMATTISNGRKHSSQLNSISDNTKEDMISHNHSVSSCSIENLKKFEKNQITKQCSNDYSSSYKFPQKQQQQESQEPQGSKQEKPKVKPTGLESWGTPDLQNVVRQSWIYEELSPLNLKERRESIKRSNSISYSPTLGSLHDSNYLNLFQNEMEQKFVNKTELEYNQIVDKIEDFQTFLQLNKNESLNVDHQDDKEENEEEQEGLLELEAETKDEDDAFNETIASLRAAKYTRLSRSEMMNHHHEIDSDLESTPRLHHVSSLLPSVIN